MKRLLLFIIILVGAFIFKIPKYVELNNLTIIEGIGIEHLDNKYTIYLKEIIPKKKENGIIYEYKFYQSSDTNLNDAYKRLKTTTKKKLYYDDVKFLVLNIDKSNKVIKLFKIKPKNIIHKNKDILKSLKAL